jgi:hypothetical protein
MYLLILWIDFRVIKKKSVRQNWRGDSCNVGLFLTHVIKNKLNWIEMHIYFISSFPLNIMLNPMNRITPQCDNLIKHQWIRTIKAILPFILDNLFLLNHWFLSLCQIWSSCLTFVLLSFSPHGDVDFVSLSESIAVLLILPLLTEPSDLQHDSRYIYVI